MGLGWLLIILIHVASAVRFQVCTYNDTTCKYSDKCLNITEYDCQSKTRFTRLNSTHLRIYNYQVSCQDSSPLIIAVKFNQCSQIDGFKLKYIVKIKPLVDTTNRIDLFYGIVGFICIILWIP